MTNVIHRCSGAEIEAHAQQVRATAGDSWLPVPLPRIAKALGVRVEGAHLGDGIAAVLVVGDTMSTIGYPWFAPSHQQRFGIAHALGHYVLHRTTAPLFIATTFPLPRPTATTPEAVQEYEATTFALALLLPPDELTVRAQALTLDFGDDAALTVLARTFDVSPLAIIMRLLTLEVRTAG